MMAVTFIETEIPVWFILIEEIMSYLQLGYIAVRYLVIKVIKCFILESMMPRVVSKKIGITFALISMQELFVQDLPS